jgi:hypothetical protein
MNVTLCLFFWVYCRIHPLNSYLNITRHGTDEEAVAHVTAFAAPTDSRYQHLLRPEPDTPGEALTTRHWVSERIFPAGLAGSGRR